MVKEISKWQNRLMRMYGNHKSFVLLVNRQRAVMAQKTFKNDQRQFNLHYILSKAMRGTQVQAREGEAL